MAEGYIKGAHAEAPGVIALNMCAASTAMLEYLARAFPFRHERNANYARTVFSVAEAVPPEAERRRYVRGKGR
jgi:hypothetical protein